MLARSIPLGIALLLGLSAAHADPPARVGRISLIEGEVTVHDRRTGESAPATLNWPVTGRIAISVAPYGRAEVRIGSTAIRLDGATDLEFVQVDDETTRLALGQGAIGVRVRDRDTANGFALETAQARVLLAEPGRYRFDAAPRAETTAVSVFQGAARVDVAGAVVAVQGGRRAEVGGASAVRLVELVADDFDTWALARDRRDDGSQSARYVSPETTGYESLDEHGDWRETPEYGPVWYPRGVAAGWAPYRSGRWAWVEPWGWTWVDDARWGFAPYHYGRWALVGGVWGWVPGVFVARPVFAPALVGWIGRPGWSVSVSIGAVPAVGWFPLAPREVFVPGYRCSTAYVQRVNVTHVTNITNISNVTPRHFAHRNLERAVTIVPVTAINAGQHVGRSIVQARGTELAAAAPVSNAPPDTVGRPPRQFGNPRRDDDDRWTRRAQPAAGPAVPTVRAPMPPQQADRRPDPVPRQGDNDRWRDRSDQRPQARIEPERSAPLTTAPAVMRPTPPATAERERRGNEPDRPVAVERERRGNEPDRRVERERPTPLPAAPPVAAPGQPRVTAPQPTRERAERRDDPRPAFASPAPRVSAPMPPPPAARVPAPVQSAPQVRMPAAPAVIAPTQVQRGPRPEADRGPVREERRGERRGS